MQKHLLRLLLIVAMMVVPWVTQGQGFSYSCDFDSDSDTAGWVFVNGSQVNQWFIGTATHNSGTKSLYISNDNGVSNAYTNTTTVFVYAYQELTLDAGGYSISYDWKAYGESDYDYIRVFLAPTSVTLPAGASPNSSTTSAYTWSSQALPTGCIGLTGTNLKLNLQSSWQSFYTDFTVPTAGTYRLVFAWANDASGGSTPPGAIDNIAITRPNCARITALHATPTVGSARITWQASSAINETEYYEVSYRYTSDTFATPTTVTTTNTNYVLSSLDPDTSYTVTVTPNCGTEGMGYPRTIVFSTYALPCLEWDTTSASGPRDTLVAGNDGTSTTYYMPINTSAAYSYCQHLIRTSDLSTTGPAAISGVGFQYAYSSPITTATNCSIYMAHTTLTTFTAMIPYDSLQLVYVGPMDFTHTGWNFIEFNQGNFNYDGVRNMVVAIVNNSGTAIGSSHVFYYNVPGVVISRREASSSPYTPEAMNAATGNNSNWRSNMRLLTGGGDCIQVASCAAPSVVVDSVAEDAIHLSWIPGYQETEWRVEYRLQGGAWIVADAMASTTEMLITGLNANSDYQFRVTALCTDTAMSSTTSAHTLCGAQALPITETFESASTGSSTNAAFINCWYRLNNGTSYFGYPYVSSSSTYNHTPSGSKGLYWYNSTTTGSYGDYQCVVLPSVNVVNNPINTLQLRFWARSSSTSYNIDFVVGVMTDPEDITTFTAVETVNVGGNTTWQEYIVDLDSYTGTGSYVALRANRASSSWYAYVDDITLREIPICPDVVRLTADEISPASAILSWQTLGGLSIPNGFEVQYDSINSTSTPLSLNVTDNFAVLTNLTPATSYKVKVRALCGSDDGVWDSVVFSTRALACFEIDPSTADTIIYSNSTSGVSGCLAYSSYGNTAYQAIYTASELTAAGLTAGSITGIDLGFTAASSYSKEFTIFLGNTSTTSISNATLEDPNAFQQVYGPAPHPVGTTGWQHYEFETPFAWDGTSSIILTTFMNQPSGVSQSSSTGLTGYYESASNKARYRYKDSNPYTLTDFNSGSSGSNYSYRAAIHFYAGECMTQATCASPLVRAVRVEPYEVELQWAPGYLEGSWDVSHRQGNSGAWVTDLSGTSLTNYTYSGLNANTQYQFRVTAQCGDTAMETTLIVTTPCSPLIALPYTQDFENESTGSSSTTSAFIPCWHRINNGTSYGGYPYVSSSSTYNHTVGGTKGLYWYNSTTTGTYGDYQVVVLPPVDSNVFQVNGLQLTFWAKSSSTTYNPTFIVGALTDPNDITTFVGIDTINVGGNTNWAEFEVPLDAYTGNGTYVALRANRSSSSWYAYVDDFTLEVLPACPHVNNLAQTDATLSTITLHWEEAGEATQWIVEYDTVDFIPGDPLVTSVVANDTTVVLTGLDSSMIYYIYVAASCGGDEYSSYRSITGRTLAAAPAELPYSCNFEGEGNNGWALLNGSMTNVWYVDSAVNNGGSKSLYISDDGGQNNNYTNSTISYAYAIRTINFVDSGEFAYSYDWRSQGESHYYDFTRVFLAPYAYQWTENDNPAGGTYNFSTWSCPAGWIELTEQFGSPATLAQSSTWRTVTGTFRLNTPGVYNLVFAWANDGSVGSNPPTAIDNVSMVQNTCPSPIVHVDHTTLDSIYVYWQPGGEESSWIVSCDSTTDVVYDTFYVFGGLSASTNYTVYVRALCDDGDTSLNGSVTTRTQCGMISAVPFGDNFNSLSTSGSDHAPQCWYGYSTYDSYYPEVVDWQDRYNSGNSLYLYMYNPGSTYTILQLPPVDTTVLPIRTLQLNFSLLSEYGSGGVVVGVCTGQGMTGFTPIDTVTVNEDYMWHDFEVPLTGYYDTGMYITLNQYCPGSDLDLYLDEVQLVLAPNCVRPRGIRAATVSTSDALVRWIPADSANSEFEIRFGRAGCNVDTLTGISVSLADSLLLTGLDSGAVYDIFVRTICGPGDTSFWTSGSFRTLASSPVNSFPYICDFTGSEGQAWNLENGTDVNKWYVGTAAYNGTADNMGLYISDNNGVSNSYNNTAVTFTYAYRTFNMPAGQYAYSFDWRCQGESQYYDFIRVFLAPASDEIIAGQSPNGGTNSYSFGSELPPTGWIDLSQVTTAPYTLNQHSTWTNLNSTFTLTSAGTYNLVFAWSNDGSGGSNPPAAIDNVQIYRNTCPSPDNFRIVSNTSTSVTVAWDGVGTPTGYELSIGTTSGSPTVDTVVTSSPVTFSGLPSGGTYYIYVRTICDNGADSSMWVGPLTAITGTWNMRANYNDTVYMCGGAIYDDGGATGQYTNSQTSTLVIYPDSPNSLVQIQGTFSGEGCCDYLGIYDGVGTSGTTFFYNYTTTGSGSTMNIGPFLSTNGPITVYFHSDGSVVYSGYELFVSCVSTSCRVFNLRLDPAYPESDNRLNITWDTNGADYYEVAYGTPGFIPTGSFLTVYTNSATITGLTPNTNYDVCVRSICNSGADTGSWTRTTFQTAICDNAGVVENWTSTSSTTTTSYGPIGYSCYNYSYTQTIIDSAQLASLTGDIVAFQFKPSNSASSYGSYYTGMDIYMANVSESVFTGSFIYPDSNHQFVQVMANGNCNYTTDDWQTITLDTSFTWDGHSNVLFAVNRSHGSYSCSATYEAHNATGSKLVYAYNDNNPYNINNASADNTSSQIGDLRLISCGASGCRQPVVTSVTKDYHSATVTWTGEGNNYEVNIKESAAPNWPATDIAVTGNSYTFNGLMPATNYMFRVRQDCTADSLDYSEWVISGVLTDSLPCLSPDSLHATAVTNATATRRHQRHSHTRLERQRQRERVGHPRLVRLVRQHLPHHPPSCHRGRLHRRPHLQCSHPPGLWHHPARG